MKILVVHNFYQQAGGEDQVFLSEARMLEKNGHTVLRFTESNDQVASMGKLQLAFATVWNCDAYSRLYSIVRKERPDIVHFHNTFPLLSPSCYYAARRGGAAVVQTLHNYRLLCPAATLLRDGRPCEDCVGATVPWHGLQHACYRGSRTASAGVVALLSVHNAAGTWAKAVDAYIALTNFSRSRFIAGGLPPDRTHIKSNFTEPDPGIGPGGNFYLYAGRLSPEKGLDVLIQAWRARPQFPELKIIGDGPLAPWLRKHLPVMPNVTWLGRMSRDQVLTQMQHARALILPSIWYENFPVSIVEAYATGLPVVVSNAGALPELVDEGNTGFVFRSGDADALAAKVSELEALPNPLIMRQQSRARYEFAYSEDKNYLLLAEIYSSALNHLRESRKL